MKILLLADIHSNWPALSAIREEFDCCLFVGDLVDYGADPIPCIDWIRSASAYSVRGNHDHAVAQRVQPRPGEGFRRLAAATRPLHWAALDPIRTKFLSRLPVTRDLTLAGQSFHLVHATPRDPMDEYLTGDAAGWRARLTGIDADFVCVGHTHVQFHLDLTLDRKVPGANGRSTTETRRIQVINPGSVGQPRDGDPRAAYAMIKDGEVSFHRVEYDIDAALTQLRCAGVDEWAIEFSEQILRSGGQVDGPAHTGLAY